MPPPVQFCSPVLQSLEQNIHLSLPYLLVHDTITDRCDWTESSHINQSALSSHKCSTILQSLYGLTRKKAYIECTIMHLSCNLPPYTLTCEQHPCNRYIVHSPGTIFKTWTTSSPCWKQWSTYPTLTIHLHPQPVEFIREQTLRIIYMVDESTGCECIICMNFALMPIFILFIIADI